MLVSKPIQQLSVYTISGSTYIINSDQIQFNDLPLIYFADITQNNQYKTIDAYKHRISFFNDKLFNFNQEFTKDITMIKKHIDLLQGVNESFIKKFIEEHKDITEDKIIQFYIDYIYYLVDRLNLLGMPNNSIIETKYNLLLKNCEMLTMLNKFNGNVINNLKNLYSELSKA